MPPTQVAVQLYTGDGKGKTTATFGLALRAAGHGQRVFIAQFMKGCPYGELSAVSAIPNIEVAQFGWEDCIRREDVSEFHIQRTHDGLETCKQLAASGRYTVLVLDEILVAQWLGLVGLEEVVDFISCYRHHAELVLTGRRAAPELVELADLVTDMACVKHPFDSGIPAREGIEY